MTVCIKELVIWSLFWTYGHAMTGKLDGDGRSVSPSSLPPKPATGARDALSYSPPDDSLPNQTFRPPPLTFTSPSAPESPFPNQVSRSPPADLASSPNQHSCVSPDTASRGIQRGALLSRAGSLATFFTCQSRGAEERESSGGTDPLQNTQTSQGIVALQGPSSTAPSQQALSGLPHGVESSSPIGPLPMMLRRMQPQDISAPVEEPSSPDRELTVAGISGLRGLTEHSQDSMILSPDSSVDARALTLGDRPRHVSHQATQTRLESTSPAGSQHGRASDDGSEPSSDSDDVGDPETHSEPKEAKDQSMSPKLAALLICFPIVLLMIGMCAVLLIYKTRK